MELSPRTSFTDFTNSNIRQQRAGQAGQAYFTVFLLQECAAPQSLSKDVADDYTPMLSFSRMSPLTTHLQGQPSPILQDALDLSRRHGPLQPFPAGPALTSHSTEAGEKSALLSLL